MRHPNWEQRLSAFVSKSFERPHEYGGHDCLLFPAGAVKAVTGKDFGRGHRGKYRSPASAVRHLKSMGFTSPEALLDSLFEERPVSFAQRGDLVLVPGDGGWDFPGVCYGDTALVIADIEGREGLFESPRHEWLKAWAVG